MTIRGWIALGALLMVPAGVRAQEAAPDTVAADSQTARVRDFMHDLADPMELSWAVVMGLYDHALVEPYEWGGGADALSQRILSRTGEHVIGTSVRHGLAAGLGRSTKDEPCTGCASVEDRIVHEFVDVFTDRDNGGRRVISEPYLAGVYAGAIAPTFWQPNRNVLDGLKSGTFAILFDLSGRVLFALLEPLVQEE